MSDTNMAAAMTSHAQAESTPSSLSSSKPPRIPSIGDSPPSRAASANSSRSASESESTITYRNPVGVRKVSDPSPSPSTAVPSRMGSPLKAAAVIIPPAERHSPIEFSSTSLTFNSDIPEFDDPFQESFEKRNGPVDDCTTSPLTRPVYRSHSGNYDSQEENSPHTMSSATSSASSDSARQSMESIPETRDGEGKIVPMPPAASAASPSRVDHRPIQGTRCACDHFDRPCAQTTTKEYSR